MNSLIYLYYGASEYILLKEVDKLIEELKVDDFNIIKYDLLETDFLDIIEELQTISFFSGKRVVLLSSLMELYKLSEYHQNLFITYLENPSPDTVLIMYSSQILDDEQPITKAFKLHSKMMKFKDYDKKELPTIIRQEFQKDDYQINDDAINELIERTNSDFLAIEQEIIKLKLYAFEHKTIKAEAVRLLVSKNLDDNIYELSSAIIERNRTKAIQIYYDLLVSNVQPITIVGYLSNRVRELIHTSLLLSRNYTQNMVARHFQVSDGRAYYMVKNTKAVGVDKLEKYLTDLANLDYEIKSGKIDPRLGVELFLLGV